MIAIKFNVYYINRSYIGIQSYKNSVAALFKTIYYVVTSIAFTYNFIFSYYQVIQMHKINRFLNKKYINKNS